MERETIARDRLLRVFRFLQALDQHRNPVKRQVMEHSWTLKMSDIPNHPDIFFPYPTTIQTTANVVFRVKRPMLSKCPEPPYILKEWLESDWQNPFKKEVTKKTVLRQSQDGNNKEEALTENPERLNAFRKWTAVRTEWAEKEVPARQTNKIFETVYELHNRLKKESENIEILIGDGILNWRLPGGGIHYPLVLQRIELAFNPEIPEFTFVDAESQPELYTGIFQSVDGIDGTFISEFHNDLTAKQYHPLEGEETSKFLKRLVNRISPKGQFVGTDALYGEQDYPRVGRAPIIFVRNRTMGFALSLQKIIDHALAGSPDMTSAIMNILGISAQKIHIPSESEMPVDATDVLLGKAANPEQIIIARTIDRHPGVLVQGPPGTGKTHTIANLIGHFLTQGNTVLVTSHTTKALRVLRDKMVDELQPLCVSLLNNDAESRVQLQSSIERIVERISTINVDIQSKKIARLENQRALITAKLQIARHSLVRARAEEYQPISIGNKDWSPSEAARFVAKGSQIHDWIPTPVVSMQSLSLTSKEVAELYTTNEILSIEDEAELEKALPPIDDMMSVSRFTELSFMYEKLCRIEKKVFPVHWYSTEKAPASEEIAGILKRLEICIEPVVSPELWKKAVVYAGMQGEKAAWKNLLEHIKRTKVYAESVKVDLARFQPCVQIIQDYDKTMEVVEQIINYLERNKSFGQVTLFMHPSWKKCIEVCEVIGQNLGRVKPSRLEHFKAIQYKLILDSMRSELLAIWDYMMVPHGAPDLRTGSIPEDYASQFSGPVSACLDWHESVWQPFVADLNGLCISWDSIMADQSPIADSNGDVLRLADGASGPLVEMLEHLQNTALLEEIHQEFSELEYIVRKYESPVFVSDLVSKLINAISRRDTNEYRSALERLQTLVELKPVHEKRKVLLSLLEKTAPRWSAKIQQREGVHGKTDVPGDVETAWTWRQLRDELERRSSVSIAELQSKVDSLNDDLRSSTNELIENKAWFYQRQRTQLEQQQALVGYAKIMKKIGAGTGVRVPQLKAEAMRLIQQCRTAVPVWIMPLARVVETFDPTTTKFDVVIIDEASQCDVMGLIAMYIAKKVVIVGDHEQVSPLAIGQNVTVVENLINQHLVGIPNAKLYDGQTSIYDLAQTSFGGLICLTEHFRCVPDIIQFSNMLSYNGKIKPLREQGGTNLRPPTIVHRVRSGKNNNKVNLEEATEIAKIVIAATKMPEFKEKTFGVISLLGEEQAIAIEKILRTELSEKEYEDREIICGVAAQFQGDERDVIFLSVVESAAAKPPHRTYSYGPGDRDKKRFNVAASRAKDQLWVIHSLDPRIDLTPNDLRRRLIEFAENPKAYTHEVEIANMQTESQFEREVLGRIRNRGYRVVTQWKVGHYRIDLVVEGLTKKLAIECDGDKYHPIEKLQEDMIRQAVLERLGWKFVRIRGSQYFRDPDLAMAPVFEQLEQMEIERLGESAPEVPSEEKLLYYKVLENAGLLRSLGDEKPEEPDAGIDSVEISTSVRESPEEYLPPVHPENIAPIIPLKDPSVLKRKADPEDIYLFPSKTGARGEEKSKSSQKSAPRKDAIRGTASKQTKQEKLKSFGVSPSENREWLDGTSRDVWFALSHWAKENDLLTPWDRKFAFDIGRGKIRGWTWTDKQVELAAKLYQKAVILGFTKQ